jgi:putative endonuclease
MRGYMYILECADGTYYTGSTVDLEKRLWKHENLMGANYTKKKHPVKLVYYEEYSRIDEAFYREKQVQGWSRAKKKALIEGRTRDLPLLSRNYTQFGKPVALTLRQCSGDLSSATGARPVVERFAERVEAAETTPSTSSGVGKETNSVTGKEPVVEPEPPEHCRRVETTTEKVKLVCARH